MITAEQARALMVDKEILREVEYAIIYAAKQGDRSCDLKDVRFVADDPCGNIRKILEYRGFEVMYWGPSDTYMNITW